MNLSRLVVACRPFLAIALVACLGACATTGKKGGNSYAQLLATAETEVTAGRVEPALVAFERAAQADPTRKEPWVRTAQLHFDAGNYGRAIVAAEEVLQRDPTDLVADSVLTVSGLRVAAQSLQRLQGNGAIASDSARTEAERLAATMRATMGDAILDSGREAPARRRSATRRAAAPATARPATTPPAPAAPAAPAAEPRSGVANPFGGMGG